MAVVGYRIVLDSMQCDLGTQHNVKDWHNLGLGSNLVFCIDITIDGASIDLIYDFESEIGCFMGFVKIILQTFRPH